MWFDSGSFKVFTMLSNTERIIEFCISGELLGFDAASSKTFVFLYSFRNKSVCKVSLEKLFN